MRPLYQPQSHTASNYNTPPQHIPSVYPHFNYLKSPDSKANSIVTNVTNGSPIYTPTNSDRKMQFYHKNGQQKSGFGSDEKKKINRFEKNELSFPRDHPYLSPKQFALLDVQPIRREQSQPDLRTTCPNIISKFQQSNKFDSVNLRNTTHGNGLSKIGAIIADAKKSQQEEQKNMKKNGISNEALSTNKIESPVRPVTSSHKPLQKPNFKSLNEMWSNKISNAQKPKRNIINGFQIYKQLGKGKFGQVYLARHVENGFIVALKKIVKAKVLQFKMYEQFKREIKLHSSLDHPNIVKFYGFFQHAENIYLILEYISGGTLFDYLAEKDTLSTQEAAQYLKDTIEALSYMHERSIAHRDIKPENIVLTAERVAKLCDFGWSALVESSRTTYCGTFDYAPPEILQRKNYDTAVDIWCIGVLTFELLTGKVPFEGQKRKQVMQKIISVDKTKINYPIEMPEDAKDFIQFLVQKDPSLRPKCKDLLKHRFFTNNLKNQVPQGPKAK